MIDKELFCIRIRPSFLLNFFICRLKISHTPIFLNYAKIFTINIEEVEIERLSDEYNNNNIMKCSTYTGMPIG